MSQPTLASPSSSASTRQSFPRWVRSTSEHHLLIAAQAEVARRYGRTPPTPKGTAIFWQKVYAPIFHALPYALRAKVANAMPGSHRQTWHRPQQHQGPAV